MCLYARPETERFRISFSATPVLIISLDRSFKEHSESDCCIDRADLNVGVESGWRSERGWVGRGIVSGRVAHLLPLYA